MFYTSLGHPDDFKDDNFRRLIVFIASWNFFSSSGNCELSSRVLPPPSEPSWRLEHSSP